MNQRKLQIFISSTYEDLIDHRLAAMEAILASGYIPVAMEQFSPGDETAWEKIRSWIDESDGFILILGGRYGSIEALHVALATSVFVGMQPVLTQVPPKRLRSMIAAFIPVPASQTASNGPACPVPITIASYFVDIGSPPLGITVFSQSHWKLTRAVETKQLFTTLACASQSAVQ